MSDKAFEKGFEEFFDSLKYDASKRTLCRDTWQYAYPKGAIAERKRIIDSITNFPVDGLLKEQWIKVINDLSKIADRLEGK